jgi:hypothetical protein
MNLPITIQQGADYTLELNLKAGTATDAPPVNLTGATFAAQIRKDWDGQLEAAFVTAIPSPATDGKIRLTLAGAVSLGIRPGAYKWDGFLTRSGVAQKIVSGPCEIVEAITRT